MKCISLERLRVYIQVYDSYGSWNNALRVVQFVNCISLQGFSGSHALRAKNIRRVLRRASHQYVNIYAVHQLYDSWTIVSRPVRVLRVVSSHSRVVSVRQYWTSMAWYHVFQFYFKLSVLEFRWWGFCIIFFSIPLLRRHTAWSSAKTHRQGPHKRRNPPYICQNHCKLHSSLWNGCNGLYSRGHENLLWAWR